MLAEAGPLSGLFLLGVGDDCRGGAAKVDPDRVGVDDPAVSCATNLPPRYSPVFSTIRSLVMWILPACTNSGSVARFPVLVRVEIVSSPSVEFG